MLEIISEAVKSMSEGELLQLQKARKLNIREEDYYKIIISKTAALLVSLHSLWSKIRVRGCRNDTVNEGFW